MAGAKETPRQKMISMMYLVLTALLALNVSVEVLDAFTTVNEGLESTNESVNKKIEDYYITFEQQYIKDSQKTQVNWNYAQEIRVKTDELINYIEREIKLELLKDCNNATEEELLNPEKEEDIVIINPEKADPQKNRRVSLKINFDNLDQLDKHDPVTSMMITYGKASELRSKINEYRQFIITTMETIGIPNYASHVGLETDKTYETSKGEILNWEYKNFNHVITPAAFSILNEIVGEVQTTEYDAISELFKNIGASDYKFNRLTAKVFPKSTYVLQGQNFEADVFIVASDDTREFNAKYGRTKQFNPNANGVQSVSSSNGIVKINIPAGGVGEQYVSGSIEMADPVTGEIEYYPFETEYTVAPPSATASPTKMNIIYRGLDNPIQISAPGFTADQLQVAISGNNSNITKLNNQGLYSVNVKDTIADKVTITTSALVDGKRIALASTDFRLKSVPAPTAMIAGKFDGVIYRDDLLAADSITPVLPDFDFDGYNYTIQSYTLSYSISGNARVEPVDGGKFNANVKKAISSSRRGDRLNFESIRAKGPDGKIVPLNSITLKIQ